MEKKITRRLSVAVRFEETKSTAEPQQLEIRESKPTRRRFLSGVATGLFGWILGQSTDG